MSEDLVYIENNEQCEAEVIGEKLYVIFRNYVRVCFWGLFLCGLAYIGLVAVVVMLIINSFRLSYYFKQLRLISATSLFFESGIPLVVSILLVLTFPLSIFGLPTAMFGFGRYGIYGAKDLILTYEALEKYAEINNGTFPQYSWRDELVFNEDKEYTFEEKDYVCLNPAALSLGNDIPDDMVLGFRAYNKCDAVGVFDKEIHSRIDLLWVILGNGDTKSVSMSQVGLIRWNLDDNNDLRVNILGISGIFTVIILFAVVVVIRYRRVISNYHEKVAKYTFLAFAAGAILGAVSLMYYSRFCHDYYGDSPFDRTASIGAIMACLFSLIYFPLIFEFRDKSKFRYNSPWITVFGSITGIICSVAVHMVLRYVCFESSFYPAIAGIPFGAWTGMVIGWLIGERLDLNCNEKLSEIEVSNE